MYKIPDHTKATKAVNHARMKYKYGARDLPPQQKMTPEQMRAELSYLVAQGYTHTEIAEMLGMHRQNLQQRLKILGVPKKKK